MARTKGPEKMHYQGYLTRPTILRLRMLAAGSGRAHSAIAEDAIKAYLDANEVGGVIDYPVNPELEAKVRKPAKSTTADGVDRGEFREWLKLRRMAEEKEEGDPQPVISKNTSNPPPHNT